MSVFSLFRNRFLRQKEIDPASAYDLWALQYDDQSGNLMLELDEQLVTTIFKQISFQDKIVMDVGCGTGRHWGKILRQQPAKLIGFDVSEGMLKALQKKFAGAETYMLKENNLNLPNDFVDVIISTLTIAHIKNIEAALKEWNRVLKDDGDVIITDYHPEALAKGAKRTFNSRGKTIAIKNYVHSIEKIKFISKQFNWTLQFFDERRIDESNKIFYEKQNALKVYEKFKGTPVIYGIHFKKLS